MQLFDLSEKEIGKEGIRVLCEALKTNTSLRELKLSGRNGEEGGQYYALQ